MQQSRREPLSFRPLRRLAILAVSGVVLSTQLGNGCSTSNDDRTTRRSDPYDDRYDDRSYERYKDSYDDNRIPSDARRVKEGRGALSFRAGSTGRFWVLDERDREVVYNDELLDGDRLTVDPDQNHIVINGRSKKVELKRDHIHRIYFDGARVYRDDYRDDRNSKDNYRDRDDRRDNPPAKKPEVRRPVPDSAKIVAEASSGGQLSYKATDNGRVYFYDNQNNVLVQTITVRKGQRLTIDTKSGVGTLDGKQVMKLGLSHRTTYRLLFDR